MLENVVGRKEKKAAKISVQIKIAGKNETIWHKLGSHK